VTTFPYRAAKEEIPDELRHRLTSSGTRPPEHALNRGPVPTHRVQPGARWATGGWAAPGLNLTTLVGTWMEPEAQQLMSESRVIVNDGPKLTP
jgi:hypothetical protein